MQKQHLTVMVICAGLLIGNPLPAQAYKWIGLTNAPPPQKTTVQKHKTSPPAQPVTNTSPATRSQTPATTNTRRGTTQTNRRDRPVYKPPAPVTIPAQAVQVNVPKIFFHANGKLKNCQDIQAIKQDIKKMSKSRQQTILRNTRPVSMTLPAHTYQR